jgi:hypothetical protein
MVTSYLQGGLGNQIFQIAVAYAHANKNHDTAVFDLNNSHTPHQGENISKYKGNIFREFNHMDNVYDLCSNTFSQPSHSYCEIPWVNNQQLQGFYQSENFFLNVKKELVNKLISGLNSEKEKYDKVIKLLSDLELHYERPCVSVHIRRGDYLKFPHVHTPCGLDFYKNALSLMKEKIGDFTPIFVSDDKKWCEETFDGFISPFTDELEDLMLMSNCSHNIIANSSFSWWGAYLNQNKDKVVIGPKKWFGLAGPQDQEDTLPKNWIKL